MQISCIIIIIAMSLLDHAVYIYILRRIRNRMDEKNTGFCLQLKLSVLVVYIVQSIKIKIHNYKSQHNNE